MSLFVCSECKAIDNTNLIKPVCDDNGMMVDLIDYPNMCQMEMDGFKEGIPDKEHVKHIEMLCSECNTGEWHGEFEKIIATDEELLLSKFSKYNNITPRDHEEGCIAGDYNNGYYLNDTYRKMFEQVNNITIDVIFNSEGNIYTVEYKLVNEHPLYQLWREDPMNFNNAVLTNLDIHSPESVTAAMKASQIYPSESRSSIYNNVINGKHSRRDLNTFLAGVSGLTGFSLADYIPNKYHKRERYADQSDVEKNTKLLLAEQKRIRKKIKKTKDQKELSLLIAKQIDVDMSLNETCGSIGGLHNNVITTFIAN